MVRTIDLIIVGSGSAAMAVASQCRAAGWTVAMIDKRPFGGTCALRGCDPKKVLVGAAAAIEAARALSGKGIRSNGLSIDWAELMEFKRTFTDPVPARRTAQLTRDGIEVLEGVARFVDPSRIAVADLQLEATRAIVIATGDRPADLSFPGRQHLVTSDQFLELRSLPSSIAFVGGGYISFEFAHVAARAGSRVTILHRHQRPLGQFDPDLVAQLVSRSRAAGIEVSLGTEVQGIEKVGARYRITTSDGHIADEADLVVHGVGRVPDIDELMLDVGGVQGSRAGVHVNEYLQSVSNPLVWAAGDCAATAGPPLTPVAGYEGRIVAANLLDGPRTTADYAAIPSVVFTLPPLARVGLSEEEARRKYPNIVVTHEDTSRWYSSRRIGEEWSGFKVLIDRSTDQIVGAHLLGPHADETINVFALAMKAGVAATRFKEMLWSYPTQVSDVPHMI